MLKPNRLEQTKFAAQQQNAASDPYLAALEFLAFFHGKPFSEAEVRKRLPLAGGKLDAESFCRAAEKSGLVAKVVDRPATDVSALVCPFVVPLKNGDVAIATEKGSKGMTRLIIPGAPNVLEVAKGTLSQQAEDVVIYVADAAAGKELESGQKLRQGHWLWSVVSKYWATWIYVVAAALFINLLGLAVPLFVMNVYDRVIPNNSISTLWALAIGVVIALVFDFILRMLRAIVVDHSGRRIDMRVSSDLFDQAMDATMASRPASAGEIASHIREFEAVRDFFTSASISSLIDLLFIGIFLGVLWLLVGPLALVALFAVPVVLIVTLLIQIPLGRAVAKSQETISNRQSVLVETLVGIETIKAMSAEGVMQRKWEEAISGSVRSGSSIRFWSSLAMFFTMFTQQCVTVLILVWGAYLVADGEISIGALVASNILAGRVLAPLSSIAMTLARTQQSMTALRQLNKLMALDRDHGQFQDNAGAVKSGAFEFSNVSFSYPREELPAIDDLSISVDAGEQVGIIGRVGSGKSTFGKLLSGLYMPGSGNVLIDGTDTRHYNRSDLREAVLYCGQDADLFTGTIRDNILVGNSADDELFEKCAAATGVSAFAQTHPLGYAMPVGERGQGLSGGQRQAVALARALIARPKILFLDEPTGSMDNHSEQLFIRGLKDWMTEETTLIISTHRNSLLELISRLVVLENGKLAADGPKQQVLDALKKKSAQSAVVKTGNGDG